VSYAKNMTPARITKFEVQGFRAFHTIQTLDIDAPVTAVWGPNSQGKTSLAEAFEFLLSGKIVRRELMASSQDEFADALRNAHMPAQMAVFVRAYIIAADGKPRMICRTLVSDYSKRQDCTTRLEIDGAAASESALRDLGFVLSHPPLSAPVLAQHTLGYLFSARPQDRATYFRALLEVSDLEAFRAEVATLEGGLKVFDDPLLGKLGVAAAIPAATSSLSIFAAGVPPNTATATALDAAVRAVIEAEGIKGPHTAAARMTALIELLADKQSRTFPVKGFDRKPPPARPAQDDRRFGLLSAYLSERAKVDEETRRLTGLFKEVLKLSTVEHAHDPIDCPVCGTKESLTPVRVAAIRRSAADTDAFRTAEQKAIEALKDLSSALDTLSSDTGAALPLFMQYPGRIRRQRAFRIDRIKALLEQDGEELLGPWLTALRPFVAAQRKARLSITRAKLVVAGFVAKPETLIDIGSVQAAIVNVSSTTSALVEAEIAYGSAERPLIAVIQTAVDRQSKTAGWQELIDLANGQVPFRAALVERAIANDLRKELQQALRQIDRGNETVLEAKFGDLSEDVLAWWDLLRPGEHSYFSAVKPRPGARRSIDFKAGLGDGVDRKTAKLRDVIAVFSQSQLHCLGLAVFLARAVHEKTGFVVLDDPILSSDEDYRAYFKSLVMARLIDSRVQTVLITQCKDTWRDISDLHGHHGVAAFQIKLSDPKRGTVVIRSGDEFLAMLTQLEPYTMHDDPDLRKIGGARIRVAAERFCKLLLVKKAREQGDDAAAVTDFNDKGLDALIPLATPYLKMTDPSHAGKLRVLRRDTNPANHDDEIPSRGALRTALGNLRDFRQRYLS
jgi:AAA domain